MNKYYNAKITLTVKIGAFLEKLIYFLFLLQLSTSSLSCSAQTPCPEKARRSDPWTLRPKTRTSRLLLTTTPADGYPVRPSTDQSGARVRHAHHRAPRLPQRSLPSGSKLLRPRRGTKQKPVVSSGGGQQLEECDRRAGREQPDAPRQNGQGELPRRHLRQP